MKEIGEGIFARTSYAIRKLAQVKGIRILHLSSPHFREFVVNFDESGKTVEEINALLAQRGIFGGHSLRRHFPEMGESALYCVTEIHTQAQIDLLADTLKEILQS
jgi:glycine dehydrogenase subunit 1